jgi:uncharacterized membrane protein HdeD (DUF308 family)
VTADFGHVTGVLLVARQWWTYVVRGILAIIFGVVALIIPGIALGALVILFAAWALTDGVTEIVRAWRTRGQRQWWVGLLEGLAGIAAAVVAVVWPGITALVLLFILALWSILTGVLEIWAAIRLREQITGELFLGLAGLLSVAFGVFLVLFPGLGLLSVITIVAFFAIVFGSSLVLLGLRLRRIEGQATRQGEYAERGF